MTPSAMTAAGRSTAAPRPAAAPHAPGHRRTTRPAPVPRGPRRVSGPARKRPGSATAAGRNATLGARALAFARALPDHALLDRIVRGRAWIPLLGVLLVGIVAMQVEILKLGTGMGRWVQRSSEISTRNQALQASVAGLMDDQRIERLAAKMGMVMPDPTAVSFLGAHPAADTTRAIANIHAPDPSSFSSQAAAVNAIATSSSAIPSGQVQSVSASGQPVDTSSNGSSSAAAGSGTSASSQPQDTSATTGSGASGQPADTGGTGASTGSGQPTGSGGAASIAPPSASQTSSTGG
jgi:hypothetical protein